jgi:transposase
VKVRWLTMFNQTEPQSQLEYELVCIDSMVPENHLLRLMADHIDFSFITELCRPYYSNHGRPSVDPILFFKMIFIGYLYGIRSERQLEQEINLNVAYRWFLGVGLSKKAPDHTTISWNRKFRFQGTTLFQDIFDEIVRLAQSHRMVGGRLLITDSTHIRANANNNRYEIQEVTCTPEEYVRELENAINEDRVAHGKKELSPNEELVQKSAKISTTDPESGFMMRKGKPEGFHYLDHRTVDHKFNIITDVHITAGNVNDATVYLERLKTQIDKFGFASTLEAVAIDSGYMTPHICKTTVDLQIAAAIGERSAPATPGIFPKEKFTFVPEKNIYLCPQDHVLTYSTTNRSGYQEYRSDSAVCTNCPFLSNCTTNKDKRRTIQRHIWEGYKEQVIQNRQTENGKTAYKFRCQTSERSFADAKELHGYRRCRYRGRENTQEQALMTAAVQNLKKITRYLAKLTG